MDQSPLYAAIDLGSNSFHLIIARVVRFRDSAVSVDVLDLADGIHGNAGVLQTFQDRRLRRFECVIAAVLRSLERTGLADEWPGDDPPLRAWKL